MRLLGVMFVSLAFVSSVCCGQVGETQLPALNAHFLKLNKEVRIHVIVKPLVNSPKLIEPQDAVSTVRKLLKKTLPEDIVSKVEIIVDDSKAEFYARWPHTGNTTGVIDLSFLYYEFEPGRIVFSSNIRVSQIMRFPSDPRLTLPAIVWRHGAFNATRNEDALAMLEDYFSLLFERLNQGFEN